MKLVPSISPVLMRLFVEILGKGGDRGPAFVESSVSGNLVFRKLRYKYIHICIMIRSARVLHISQTQLNENPASTLPILSLVCIGSGTRKCQLRVFLSSTCLQSNVPYFS